MLTVSRRATGEWFRYVRLYPPTGLRFSRHWSISEPHWSSQVVDHTCLSSAFARYGPAATGAPGVGRQVADSEATGSCARVSARAGPTGAIGAVVARFVHTEEVTGSNPVSPTSIERRPGGAVVARLCRLHRRGHWFEPSIAHQTTRPSGSAALRAPSGHWSSRYRAQRSPVSCAARATLIETPRPLMGVSRVSSRAARATTSVHEPWSPPRPAGTATPRPQAGRRYWDGHSWVDVDAVVDGHPEPGPASTGLADRLPAACRARGPGAAPEVSRRGRHRGAAGLRLRLIRLRRTRTPSIRSPGSTPTLPAPGATRVRDQRRPRPRRRA